MTTTGVASIEAGTTSTTMTTTERSRPSPSRTLGASNLRLSLAAFLATVYVLAWWLFGARTPARADADPALAPALETNGQPRLAAWFHDIPAGQRPAAQLPAGWHIVERAAPAPRVTRRDGPAPMRVSPARVGRLRTRSS